MTTSDWYSPMANNKKIDCMETETNTQKLTLAEVLRPLAQLCINLAGKNGRNWFEALKRFLRKEEIWVLIKWKLWIVVKIGTLKPNDQLISLIKKNGIELGKHEEGFLKAILEFSPREEMAYYTIISPADLGLKKFTLGEFYKKAFNQGLDLCLSGDVFEIISQDNCKLEKEESVFFAMRPVKMPTASGIGFYDAIFYFLHSWNDTYNLWDCTGPSTTENLLGHGNTQMKFVFRIRKKEY